MFPVTLQKFLVFLVLAFYKHVIKACDDTVITSCRNDSNYCTQTYGQLYNALASNKNHFNISEALYPSKRPPSVLVHVTLFGDNETANCCPVTYTWSTLCLYAAFPSFVLEILSFGSVLVYTRTQVLAVTIPPFCCDVSVDDRMTMIDKGLASVSKHITTGACFSKGVAQFLSLCKLLKVWSWIQTRQTYNNFLGLKSG